MTGRRRIKPARATAQALFWVGISLAFLTLFFYNYFLLQTAAQPGQTNKLYDFKLFYVGALDWQSGGSLYRPAPLDLPFARIADKNGNTPVAALPFVGLARLPLVEAGMLWTVLSLGVFLWGASLVWRVYGKPLGGGGRASLLLVLLVIHPVALALQLGTWSLLIAGLDFAVWYAARQGRDRQAGAILGFVVSVRWQPFPLFLYFVARRRWWVVGSALLSAVVLNGLAWLVFGWQNFEDFARLVFNFGNTQSLTRLFDGSLRAEWGRLFELIGLKMAGVETALWAVSGLALLGFSLWRARRLSYDYGYSLLLVVGLLLAPTNWMHYHMALVLPLALIARRRLWLVLFIGAYWLLWSAFDLLNISEFDLNSIFFGSVTTGYLLALWLVLFLDGVGESETDKTAPPQAQFLSRRR